MPVTPFSVFDYLTLPAYPAVLDVRLSTTPVPDDLQPTLAAFVEAFFKGYRRHTGTRSALFGTIKIGAAAAVAVSNKLSWTSHDTIPIPSKSALICATFPGEVAQLVAALPFERTLSDDTPGTALVFSLSSDIITLV